MFLGDREPTATVYDGAALAPGQTLEGLAIVDDVDTTTVVPEGARLEIDGMRNYVFEIEPSYKPEATAARDHRRRTRPPDRGATVSTTATMTRCSPR